jgi:hypothetical protein
MSPAGIIASTSTMYASIRYTKVKCREDDTSTTYIMVNSSLKTGDTHRVVSGSRSAVLSSI